ncbi:MAG: amidohydrolase family protein [Solirubrobacterales bacterium]|nr:amidohydrolase family protein [Solirubrobacterales bacterium]
MHPVDGGSSTVLIRGCDLLAQPGQRLTAVDIEIADGAIRRISSAGENPAPQGAEEIDGAGLLAMPGLVNAHSHSPENCLRGVGEGLLLEPWLLRMFGSSGLYTAEDHYVNAMAGAVEMLLLGVTTVVDHLWMTPPSLDGVAGAVRAYEEVGIRAGVAPLMNDCDFTGELADAIEFDLGPALMSEQVRFLEPDDLLAQFEEAVSRWHGSSDGRIRILAGPGGVQWCSDELLGGLADAARNHGTGLHIHLLETFLQKAVCEKRFGRSGVAALEDLGVLGPNCSLPHSVWIEEEDIDRIVATDSIVVHNPAANLRLGSGRCPVGRLHERGGRVAVGTDGSASSDNQNLWEMVKLAALIHNDGPRWVSGADAITMATTAGHGVLAPGDRPDGRIVEGAVADLILLDQSADGLAGVQMLEAGLALSESGRSVRHVIVDGRVVVRDGRLTTVDADAVRSALREQVERRRRDVEAPPASTGDAMSRMNTFIRSLGESAATVSSQDRRR